MAWTTIKGRRYYRQSYRQNGQVKNRYIGSERLAMLICLQDEERRKECTIAKQTEQAAIQQGLESDAKLILTDSVIKGLTAVVAQEAGFRIHHRQWRSQRPTKNDQHISEYTMLNATLEKAEVKKRPPLARLSFAGLPVEDQRLLKAASEGDRVALSQVKKYTIDPDYISVWGDPAHAAFSWLISEVAGNDLVVQASTIAKVRAMREEFGFEKAPAFQKLAITRIIHNWLHVSVLEVRLMQQSMNSQLRDRIERQLTQAEKRLMQSLKTLAILCNLPVESVTKSLSTSTVDE